MDRSAFRRIEAFRVRGAEVPRLRGWQRDAAWNSFVVLSGFAIYTLSYEVYRVLYPGASWREHALQNAQRVVDLERTLGILGERQLQAALVGNAFAMRLLDSVYLWLHIPLIVIFAVWLFRRDRRCFRLTRNAFLIAGAIALVCELWPVAPPYLVGGLHLIDTSAKSVGGDVAEPKLFFNTYGAMPSIHVGWALLMALAVWRTTRARWLRAVVLAWPVLMAVSVVATGNHYYLDVIGGVVAALIGLWLGVLLLRRWDARTAAASIESIVPH